MLTWALVDGHDAQVLTIGVNWRSEDNVLEKMKGDKKLTPSPELRLDRPMNWRTNSSSS